MESILVEGKVTINLSFLQKSDGDILGGLQVESEERQASGGTGALV